MSGMEDVVEGFGFSNELEEETSWYEVGGASVPKGGSWTMLRVHILADG